MNMNLLIPKYSFSSIKKLNRKVYFCVKNVSAGLTQNITKEELYRIIGINIM